MNFLARREHSRTELYRKLSQKCEDTQLLNQVLDQLATDNLQSDDRFAEEFVRYRSNRGFGPLHIQADLKSRGVSGQIISDYIDESDYRWFEKLTALYQKRYAGEPPIHAKEQSKRIRFLQSRGFSHGQIRRVMDTAD